MARSDKPQLRLYVLDSGVELTLALKDKSEIEQAKLHLSRLRGTPGSTDQDHYVLTKEEYDLLFEVLRRPGRDHDR